MLPTHNIVLVMHALIATLQLAVKHQAFLLTAILLMHSFHSCDVYFTSEMSSLHSKSTLTNVWGQ